MAPQVEQCNNITSTLIISQFPPRFVGGSAGTGKVNGSFGASIGWNHVNDMTTGGANLFTMSEIQCCVYISEMFEFLRPPFHPNFIAGLHTLTETYDEHSYRRYVGSALLVIPICF